MWELDHNESWAPKHWCFWTVGLEKTIESPLDCKEIQPVYPKGNQSWIWRSDVEAETAIPWPPDVKSWLIWKDPDAGKDWRQEKGTTEDEMVGWHHRLHGYEFEQAPGVGDGQGGLACCSAWGRKESDTTERLNWTELGKMCMIDLTSFGVESGPPTFLEQEVVITGPASWASWLPGSHSHLWGRHWFGCEWGPSGRESFSWLKATR